MKKLMVCSAVLSCVLVSSSAHAGAKWWQQMGIPMVDSRYGFERVALLEKYNSTRYEQSAQWSKKQKSSLLDTSKMRKAGIVTKQYFDGDDVATLEVGTNFYRLSTKDMHRVVKSFDVVYNYSAQGAGMIRLKDSVTGEIVGTYGADGTFMY